MILLLLFQMFLALVDWFLNLLPEINLNLNIDFIGVIAHVFRYAGVIIHVPILLIIWGLNLLMDHFNFFKKLGLFLKSFIPGE